VSGADRRPLASRGAAWARALARLLTRAGIAPNTISFASLLLAAGGGALFLGLPDAPSPARGAALLGGAAAIQLRLLANLMDGMVAIEGGKGRATGILWNDAPDRLADLFFLVPAGYALPFGGLGPFLGWGAGAAALLTAYVRLLGGSLGLPQDFRGPMAKPHRMATLTVACLLEAIASFARLPFPPGLLLAAALAIAMAGGVLTAALRLARIARALESR
jgi:phosphatidylglycerophosphate synthase